MYVTIMPRIISGLIRSDFNFRAGMKRINIPIIVLFVVFFVKQVLPQVYISPDGDDSNPGTIDEPVKSFPVAINKAQAGDTIYVHQIIRLLIVTLILMLIPDKAMQMALHLNRCGIK